MGEAQDIDDVRLAGRNTQFAVGAEARTWQSDAGRITQFATQLVYQRVRSSSSDIKRAVAFFRIAFSALVMVRLLPW